MKPNAFGRALAIQRAVYPDGRHARVGVALSNLASVYLAQGEHTRAEPLFREAIAVLTETQSAGHINVAVAEIRLGRTLVREGRIGRRRPPCQRDTGLTKKVGSSSMWLRTAREDLAAVFDALNQPEKARVYRAELRRRGGPFGCRARRPG